MCFVFKEFVLFFSPNKEKKPEYIFEQLTKVQFLQSQIVGLRQKRMSLTFIQISLKETKDQCHKALMEIMKACGIIMISLNCPNKLRRKGYITRTEENDKDTVWNSLGSSCFPYLASIFKIARSRLFGIYSSFTICGYLSTNLRDHVFTVSHRGIWARSSPKSKRFILHPLEYLGWYSRKHARSHGSSLYISSQGKVVECSRVSDFNADTITRILKEDTSLVFVGSVHTCLGQTGVRA